MDHGMAVMPTAATACPSRTQPRSPSCGGADSGRSDAWPDAPIDACGASHASDNCSTGTRSTDGNRTSTGTSPSTSTSSSASASTCPSSIGIGIRDKPPLLDANILRSLAGSCDWPHSPCNSRPVSPTYPAGSCTLGDEDVWIGLDLEGCLEGIEGSEGLDHGWESLDDSDVDRASGLEPQVGHAGSGLSYDRVKDNAWDRLPPPPPPTAPYSYPTTPTTSTVSLWSTTLEGIWVKGLEGEADEACACNECLGLRGLEGSLDKRDPGNARHAASHRHILRHQRRHTAPYAPYPSHPPHPAHLVKSPGSHRRGSSWAQPHSHYHSDKHHSQQLSRSLYPPSPARHRLPISSRPWPPAALPHNSLLLVAVDGTPLHHGPMHSAHHNLNESFDRDLFDRSDRSDRDRWRMSMQSLSSLRRSLSLSSNQRHGQPTNRSPTSSAYPHSDARTNFGSASPLSSIPRSVASSEGSGGSSGPSSRARPQSVLLSSSPHHHHPSPPYYSNPPSRSSYVGSHPGHGHYGHGHSHGHGHGHYHGSPPSLPQSPVSSLDTSLALGSPAFPSGGGGGGGGGSHYPPYPQYPHATPHGPRGPSSGYHFHPSYTSQSPPSIASVSAASTAASAHHRAPPSGPSSPRPDVSYTSIPSTALRLDGFDTRMFDQSPPLITNSPLPRVPSPGLSMGSLNGRDKRISVISSVGTDTTASRSVRERESSDTTSPSLSSSTRGSRHPFPPSDEYGLSDFAIQHTTSPPATLHSFHDTVPTSNAISPRTLAAPLVTPLQPSRTADPLADLSPTLAPTSTVHTPLAPPLALTTRHHLEGDATPPSTARGARPIPTDGRVFTPSPNLSPSSRNPTPQGSVLSTPFEERDHYPPFEGLPRIPIHPLGAVSFGGSGAAAGAHANASLSIPRDPRDLRDANDRRSDLESDANMHGGLRVHKHRGQHSSGHSPDPSPKGSHSPLQSDARSIKSNKQRRAPPMYDGGYLGSPGDNSDTLTHHPQAPAPPSPQPKPHHLLHARGPPLVRTAPKPTTIETDFHSYDPHPGPGFRNSQSSQHHDLAQFQPARHRGNRASQMTTSSISSDTSTAMSPSGIRPGQPWGLPAGFEKRPSVATVFEDEPLDDLEYDGATGVHEFGQRTAEWQGDRDSFHRTSGGGLQLSHSAPSASKMYGGPPSAYGNPSPRQHRSSTVSNATTSSNKSKGSVHPFAVNRAPSPLLSVPEQLAPPGQTVTLTRSLPSLYDDFKAHTTPAPAHQVALVSTEDEQDDAICPLCTESLSFSYRLPGEKPHIIPECGHALHNDCFVECYGRVPPEGSRPTLGVCGMCRQPMVVSSRGQEHGSGKNKLAALMGGDEGPSMGVTAQDTRGGDDALEAKEERAANDTQVIVPSITIKSEYPSVRRNAKGKLMLTAMLTIDVPSGLNRTLYAPRSRREASNGGELSPPLPPSPQSATSFRESMLVMANGGGPSHFANIELELRDRVEDYATSGIGSLGHLKLYDILKVRKRDVSGELQLYLFDYGLVCISEERRSSTLRHLFGNHRHQVERKKGPKTYLKVRGRVHLHHILAVQDTSSNSEHVLTLDVETEDDGHHLFHIYFRDSGSLEMWHKTLVRLHQEAMAHTQSKASKLTGVVHMGNRPGRALPLTPTMAPSFTDFTDSCLATCGAQCPGNLAFQIPLAPVHTPIDLVIAVSTVPLAQGARVGRKQLTLRNALQCALACMGPRDRIALVCTELGANSVMRRTPLLNPTHHDSRLRLETFIDMLCLGEIENDEFAVPPRGEERADVATAVNLALDVVLSRKAKNPLTGVLLVSDLPEPTSRAHMSMVNARLEAARIQIHTFGFGKAHEPSPLWAMTNQTSGTYTFVREWHDLRDAVVGCVGGLMSVAVTNMKLRLSCQDEQFRVQKVTGATSAIVHSSGKTVDVEMGVLRHSERREILIEFEANESDDPPSPETERRLSEHPTSPVDDDVRSHHSLALARKESMVSGGASVRSRPSMRGPVGFGMDMMHPEDGMVEEVPVLEVDCSFHDPAVGRSVARLTNPVLLTVAVLPVATQTTAMADAAIVRRRMELISSDMITRGVMAATRKNWVQALSMLRGTKNTVEALCDQQRQQLAMLQAARRDTGPRTRRELNVIYAVEGLAATAQDVEAFVDGLEESREMFEADHRNYAAQQAVILRTQISWTMRTPTELHYATPCVQQLIQAGREWKARQGTS